MSDHAPARPRYAAATERMAVGASGETRSRAVDADEAVAAAYDARAAEYIDLLGSIDQLEAADRALIGSWRDRATGRVLDAGCGPGLWTEFLYAEGREAVGVDISARFLASARSRYPRIEFHEASLRRLPFEDAAFIGILAWYSLIHTPPEEIPASLAELARVTAPGGSLLVGYFDGPAGEPFAHAITTAYLWDAASLTEILAEAGFDVVTSERRDREPGAASGRAHGSVTAVRR